jgi:hypothetical protein
MIRPWKTTLRATPNQAQMLVTDPALGDLLKARLPMNPSHPRALLTLLEGIALWQGRPIVVAISANDPSCSSIDSRLFGDELWPGESALVHFEVALRGCRRRLPGLGDFRALRGELGRGQP